MFVIFSMSQESLLPGTVDLAGAIAAFDTLAREAYSIDPRCFSGLFLAQTATLLRQAQAGRVLDELDWLESFEAARLVSEIRDGGLHA